MPLELTTANPSGVPDPDTTTHDNLIVETETVFSLYSTSGYDQSTVDGRVSVADHVISSKSPIISITEETSQLDLIHISAQSEISPTQIPSIPTATNSYTDTINIQTKLPNWIPLPNWVRKTTEEPATIFQTSEPLPTSTAPQFETKSTSIEPNFQATFPTTKFIESTPVINEQVIKPITTSITTQATEPFTTSVTSPDVSTFTTQVTTQVTTTVTTTVTKSNTKPVTTRVNRPASQAVTTSSTTRVTSESFQENTRQTVTRQVTTSVDTTTNPVATSFIESGFTLPPEPVTLSTTEVKRTVSATDISNIDKLSTKETTQISSVAQPSSNTGVIVLEENFGKATTESGSIATSFKPANTSSSIDLATTGTNQIKPDTTQNNSTITNNFTISDKQAYNSTAPPCDDCEEHSWFWILAGIAIGGLVFGVICYAMGSCCSQISAAKLSRVESVEESPQTSSQPNSSTNPDLSLYGESYL